MKEKNYISNSESSSSSHVESYLKNENKEENKLKSNLVTKKSSNLIENEDKNNNEENKNLNDKKNINNNNSKIFFSNADKKTFQTLTPFKDSQINDEIYPGEDFIICNKSSNKNNIIKNIIFEENNDNNDSNNLNTYNNLSNIIFEFKKKTENNFDIINEESFTLDRSYENLNEISNYSYSDNKLIQAEVKNLLCNNKKNDFYKTINYNNDNSNSSITSENKSDDKSNNYSISKPVSPQRIKFAKFDKRNKCYSFNNVSILKKKNELTKKKTKKEKISFSPSIIEKKNTCSNVNFRNLKDNNSETFYFSKSRTRRKSRSNKNLLYNNLKDLIDFNDSSSEENNKKNIKRSLRQSKKDDELLFLVNNNINQNLLINNNQNFGNQYLKTMTKEIISQKRSLNSNMFN